MALGLAQAIDYLWSIELPERNSLKQPVEHSEIGTFSRALVSKAFLDVELLGFSDNIYPISKPWFFLSVIFL